MQPTTFPPLSMLRHYSVQTGPGAVAALFIHAGMAGCGFHPPTKGDTDAKALLAYANAAAAWNIASGDG